MCTMVVCGGGGERIVRIREMSRAFKFAAGFQVFAVVCIWVAVVFSGGENRSLMAPLAWLSIGSQLAAALMVYIGLTDENQQKYRRY